MSLVPVSCPYCNAVNNLQIVEKTVTDKLSLKLIAHEETDNRQIPSYEFKCRLCLREYELIKSSDYSFIKASLMPLSPMLDAFKTHFENYTLESAFDHIVGLARPKKNFGDRVFFHSPHLHIFFELDGKRAYIDCEQTMEKGRMGKTILRGLDIGIAGKNA